MIKRVGGGLALFLGERGKFVYVTVTGEILPGCPRLFRRGSRLSWRSWGWGGEEWEEIDQTLLDVMGCSSFGLTAMSMSFLGAFVIHGKLCESQDAQFWQ